MTKKQFSLEKMEKESVGRRVRAILGVPEQVISNEVISSPEFRKKAEKYVNKYIKDSLELLPEDYDKSLLEIASMYYISYLLCSGMDARLPKQMENLSTKTIFQTINWDEKAIEFLNRTQEVLDNFLEEYDLEENTYTTIIDLSDETSYPESNI